MTLTVAVMSLTRHQVRVLYLDPFTTAERLRVVPQWGNFALFVVCLAAALWTVYAMTRRVLADRASGDEAA